jgi:hypothetical protein
MLETRNIHIGLVRSRYENIQTIGVLGHPQNQRFGEFSLPERSETDFHLLERRGCHTHHRYDPYWCNADIGVVFRRT